jgi:hypothetical protein
MKPKDHIPTPFNRMKKSNQAQQLGQKTQSPTRISGQRITKSYWGTDAEGRACARMALMAIGTRTKTERQELSG